VLANVATGVIAVDEGLRVTMANRAPPSCGDELAPGDLLPRAAPPEWLVVWNAVSRVPRRRAQGIVSASSR